MADVSAAQPGATGKKTSRPEAMTRSDPDAYRAELDHLKDNLDKRKQQHNYREADLEVREAEPGWALQRCPQLRAGFAAPGGRWRNTVG